MSDPKREADRVSLVEIFAEVYGFKLPLREFQRMAIEQIDGHRIDAILAAGWSPDGTKAKYEAAEARRRSLTEATNKLFREASALADVWERQGFAEHPGKHYADELRRLIIDSM